MDEKELMAAIETKMADILKKFDEKAESSEIEKLKLELEELRSKATTEQFAKLKADYDSLNTVLVKQGETIAALKEKKSFGETKSELAEEIAEKKEDFKKLAKGAEKEVELKALVLRSAITNNANGYFLPEIGQLATRKLSAYDIFPKFKMGKGNHNGTVIYHDWDKDTMARAAAAIAEGAAFPESTAKWVKGSQTLKKVGDSLTVTEEFFEDEEAFASELNFFLQTNVALEIDRQIILGDGTSNTMTGIISTVSAYTPVAAAIQDPNHYDLIVKVAESITKTGGAKYSPDVVLMNITEINKMGLTKDQNDNYLLPPFVSRDGKNVAGITVIQCDIMDDNTMVVCDRRYARIYEMPGMNIEKGYVGTQFSEDEMTLKIKQRMLFLIRGADLGGFAKVTSISAALTTLAT